MPKFNKQVFFSVLAVVLLAVAVCFRFFGEIILHPDEFLFGPSGDGLKNYFSVAYQVIHGDGLWFNGMLYPYGDHLMFADGQPLLTKILQFFIEPDVSNGQQIISIMNLLMIGSLVVAAWCVHRLLVWNYVNPWFAVPFSLTLAFLSPQLARFVGHYALGYTFFVPMSWLLIASFSRSKWPWLIALVTSVFVFAFGYLHPYYLFIFVIFLGAILGWELIIKRFRFTQVKQLLPRIFTLIVPLVVFMILQSAADPYSDRPTSPAGIYSFMATFYSVFTPVYDPFRHLFHSYLFRIFIPTSWEGNAYIGIVATVILVASIFTFGKRVLSRNLNVFSHPVLPPVLRSAFIPSILVLLFSMGLFHRLGLLQLSDLITPIKQFRSLGRIAWVFYYVFSVWAVYHLYVMFRYFRSVNNGRFTYHISILIAVCAFVWMLDAIVNIKFHKAQMLNRNAVESFSEKYLTDWKSAGVNVEAHQAILPLPLQLIGSEKIGLENGHRSLAYAMKGAFSSGLPIIGGAMSRTSMEVTEKTAQLVANSLFPRPILDDMNDDLKLLLLRSNEPLNREENRLIGLAEKVFDTKDYKLYSVSVKEIKSLYSELASLPDSAHFVTPKYRTPSEFKSTEESLWGQTSYKVEAGSVLMDSTFTKAESLNLSYWVKVDPKEELLPNRRFTIDGASVDMKVIGSNPNLLNGWLLISEELKTEPSKRHIFSIHSRGGVISRIMLRDASETTTHRETDGKTFVNNIPLP